MKRQRICVALLLAMFAHDCQRIPVPPADTIQEMPPVIVHRVIVVHETPRPVPTRNVIHYAPTKI